MAEPAWSVATLFPPQGSWSEAEYLAFSAERTGIEYKDGHVEVLPGPTDRHQSILGALFLVLAAYARREGGRARTAGVRVEVRPGVFRQPDVVFLAAERLHLRANDFWRGADLVIEVLSRRGLTGPSRSARRPRAPRAERRRRIDIASSRIGASHPV